MTTQIESFYQLRRKYRGAHVLGLGIFFLAWLARSIFKIADLKIANLHLVIFLILLLSLAYLAYYAIKLNVIEHKIREEPSLNEALHDELFKMNELKAWKTAFFAVIGFNILAAILSLMVNIEDLMLIFITTIMIGFGSYSVTLYILER